MSEMFSTQKMCIRDRVWSDTVAAGIVISSDPDAGASVKSGTGVNLTVSKGPQPVTVVSYVGKPPVSYTHLDVYKRQQ